MVLYVSDTSKKRSRLRIQKSKESDRLKELIRRYNLVQKYAGNADTLSMENLDNVVSVKSGKRQTLFKLVLLALRTEGYKILSLCLLDWFMHRSMFMQNIFRGGCKKYKR